MLKENTEEKQNQKKRDQEVTDKADKKSTEGIDYCINPGNPEAIRNDQDEEACDQGRGGTFDEKL